MNLKFRLALMNFLEFAVWGAYLTCMGNYLGVAGLGDQISWFYAIQGIVSIFMPTSTYSRRGSWDSVTLRLVPLCSAAGIWERRQASAMNCLTREL